MVEDVVVDEREEDAESEVCFKGENVWKVGINGTGVQEIANPKRTEKPGE